MEITARMCVSIRATHTKKHITSTSTTPIDRVTLIAATVAGTVIMTHVLATIRVTSGNIREIIGHLRTRAVLLQRAQKVAWTVTTPTTTTTKGTCWSISAEISPHAVSHMTRATLNVPASKYSLTGTQINNSR